MHKDDLCVIITDEDGKICGALQELNNGHVTKQKEFDPLTVLGDLINVATCDDTLSPYPQDTYSFKQDYMEHPFFLGRAFRGDTQLQESLRFVPFFIALDTLKKIIVNGKRLSMSGFEVLKQFLRLKFTFSIEFQEISEGYKLGYKILNGKKVSEYQYSSVNYDYNFDMKRMFAENSGTTYRFIYSCSSIVDVTFSVLHYLMLFEYKFAKCEHCGNYFATKTLKQKYCKRKSPYKGYEGQECEGAVKNILQDFKRRKNRIYTRLNNYSDYREVSGFLKDYHEKRETVRGCPSVENLSNLEQFLIQKGGTKRQYKRKTD